MVDLRLRKDAIVADRTGLCLKRMSISRSASELWGTCHSSHVPPLSRRSGPVSRTQDDDARVAAWNTQREKDRAEQNQQGRQVRQVKVAQHGSSKTKQINSAERPKRTNHSSTHSAPPVTSANRSNHSRLLMPWVKLNNFEHVELDYFTARRPLKNIRKTKT
jgi:hypothetical protein